MKTHFDFKMKEIIVFLKEAGFVYQGSEIYGGLANSWDYGPLGTILKNKIKQTWWKTFIKNNEFIVPLESSILLNSKVWEASGHLENFNDPLVDCYECKARFRADLLIEHYNPNMICDSLTLEELDNYIRINNIKCLKCQKQNFTKVRQFQLMFETFQGTIQDNANKIYLRPETAQGIFINFNNIKKSFNKKLPFGIGQIGKSFRNEVTPGNFIFRTLEFEQMEIEFFFSPDDKTDWFNTWVKKVINFIKDLGISESNIKVINHNPKQLSHYSLATTDINYNFPFGLKELCGVANRGNYDLKQHSERSGEKLQIENLKGDELIIPHVIEPSIGVERLLLAVICDNLIKEKINNKERIILKLNKFLAPFHVAVSSLNKNKLNIQAKKVYKLLQETKIDVTYEEKANIGKVYNYHDSIGTLFCITIDYQTSEDNSVTVRERDSMLQTRVAINKLVGYLYRQLED